MAEIAFSSLAIGDTVRVRGWWPDDYEIIGFKWKKAKVRLKAYKGIQGVVSVAYVALGRLVPVVPDKEGRADG